MTQGLTLCLTLALALTSDPSPRLKPILTQPYYQVSTLKQTFEDQQKWPRFQLNGLTLLVE